MSAIQHASHSLFQIKLSVPVVCSDTDSIATGAGSTTLGPTRGLLVTTAGKIKVTYENGTTDDPFLAAGVWHPMSVTQVWSTGTDSGSRTGIKAGY